MDKLEDLQTPTWCPGCGNFGLWGAFKNAALKKGWDNTNSVLVAGIGCHGNILNFIRLTSFEGLHGRALPLATGIKIANHRLNVFVFTGDGDCLGEGGNHFIHTCRRNHNLTVLLHNNAIYGLTTGQTTPTSPHSFKSKSTPQGNPDWPISPLGLAIASGATFVARGYSGNLPKLTELIIQANEHQGLSVVEILQPCTTWNKEYTHPFFQENTYFLGENHDTSSKEAAFDKSLQWGVKQIPLGIFYQVEAPTFESQLLQIAEKPLIESSPKGRDLSELLKKYT
ncbi:MAG: 2-oxoacid:ferredoxin oxidoreductase subunit beta [Candidatus Daviesbacteria bacterium GW2011_GWA1_41_61]|uniref:2-oxoacid:ferredoxin oxidoreductase subunit beta n=1 Tax=Candidatus Daviesbacteria bacterium GW2011_GWA2_40_9 TaxID=1618424 RepID=A0A0G0U085_9BACT|nr:MAG: 2-oxoacid:ferredoxin oxidoreductase subunit beta [Candidatus Daviesbacteria bacterium GW2011_GWC1_40_9]KKR82498.1 MAG: 2-oxoacid:ferredoxin oxidoreductase subunit beta [Candidatus Daviesbacteria bacterium GW2011_GWA2_40_9]KKR93143.1 MAG: 2-oxoacid:ferredoxin oxidoreductase subunit beta [Candidatus Daviesbacteria bacterium GW2011_GWB1_41_15]KKS15687.1 MAG: 2-oxoacid:ferredoxin oxidoreductase subunit beta [Candidatus Daviesbacteria bacterium GW2011_GWA1_41_61]